MARLLRNLRTGGVAASVYPDLYTEMGISLQPSRSILGLKRRDIENTLSAARLPVAISMGEFDEPTRAIPPALEDASDFLASCGFPEARHIADVIADRVGRRANFTFDEGAVKTLS